MTTQRFFVHPDWIRQGAVQITGPLVHQMRNVLRMRPGDQFVVLDNSGWEYQAELEDIDAAMASAHILQKRLAIGEPRTKIRLYQGLLKGRHFEWVLQKCTEIGIVEFVPVISDRCLISSLDDISSDKMQRWQRIILEAAEQSHRGRLPRLHQPVLFSQACDQIRQAGLGMMLWESETKSALKDILQASFVAGRTTKGRPRRPFSISMLIGPEGGFTQEEADLAQQYGLRTITMGARILRAETAGLVAATAILYEMDDLAYADN